MLSALWASDAICLLQGIEIDTTTTMHTAISAPETKPASEAYAHTAGGGQRIQPESYLEDAP
jgi:hypothetical protein